MAPKNMESRPFPYNQKSLSPRSILMSSCGMFVMILVVYLFHISDPHILLMIGVMTFSLLYGTPSGITCSAIMFLYSLYFYSIGHSMVHFHHTGIQKLIVLFVVTVLILLLTSYLRNTVLQMIHSLEEENRRLIADNRKLTKLSRSDALTSLQNRLAMEEALLSCKGKDLHVMLIDVDNFKDVNDHYGHDIGDQVLSILGRVLKNSFGAENCYRYGGDELLVIYPTLDEKLFLQKVKELTQSFKLLLHTKALPSVAISGGYVYGQALEDYDVNLMVKMADCILYESKEHGKKSIQGTEFSRILAQNLQNNYCSIKGRLNDRETHHLLARTS